jgi:hypothetical protein
MGSLYTAGVTGNDWSQEVLIDTGKNWTTVVFQLGR